MIIEGLTRNQDGYKDRLKKIGRQEFACWGCGEGILPQTSAELEDGYIYCLEACAHPLIEEPSPAEQLEDVIEVYYQLAA